MTTGTYYSNPREDVLAMSKRDHAKTILEIGGGDFPTLVAAQSRIGGETWGVDIRASATKLDHMIVGSITDPCVQEQLGGRKFDLIIANDVIEHVEDSEEFFSVIKELLAPDGEVLLSVPNVRNVKLLYHVFIQGRFPRHEAGLFDRTHLRWFCRKDVEGLAHHAKLKVIDHRYGGRLVKAGLSRFRPMEFVSLHNLFCLIHRQD